MTSKQPRHGGVGEVIGDVAVAIVHVDVGARRSVEVVVKAGDQRGGTPMLAFVRHSALELVLNPDPRWTAPSNPRTLAARHPGQPRRLDARFARGSRQIPAFGRLGDSGPIRGRGHARGSRIGST